MEATSIIKDGSTDQESFVESGETAITSHKSKESSPVLRVLTPQQYCIFSELDENEDAKKKQASKITKSV